MSQLKIFKDNDPQNPELETSIRDKIAFALGEVGVSFEQWETQQPIENEVTNEEIITAYKDQIDKLIAENGYQSFDVINMNPDYPQKQELRNKFLSEHTHSDDEVRFFVKGKGLFSLHIGNKVFEVTCEKGDLISVPAGTPHWFDMGDKPYFTSIRLFNSPDGWVANYTGSDIAKNFSRLS